MNENFQRSVDFVIDVLEGGDKLVTDAGGLTKYGISQRWHPEVDIANLTRAQAIEIYRNEYWANSGAALMPWPIDLIVFDCRVNQTVALTRKIRSSTAVWQDLLLARLEAYVSIPGPVGDGWPDRLLKIWKFLKQGESS